MDIGYDRMFAESRWVRPLDRQTCAVRFTATGLHDRRYYKIFYSYIHPFPLLALGYNPGGATDGTDLNASDSFYENWEHDFVCFRHDSRYLLAGPACGLLARSLDTDSM